MTDAVLGELMEWQSQPLERIRPIAFLDALQVKFRNHISVKNQAVYLALGRGFGRHARRAWPTINGR